MTSRGGGAPDHDRRPARPPLRAQDVDAGLYPVLHQEALYEQIAGHVRGLIMSRRLRPGARLPAERQLAQILGVSRVPVREAMRTLSEQGLVEVRRGQGMYVASASLETAVDRIAKMVLDQRNTLTDLFAVRRLIEPASARWAASTGDPVAAFALRSIVEDMRRDGIDDPSNFERIEECDTRLHVEIARASGNRVVLRTMEAIRDLHRQQLETSLRYRDRVSETVHDHSRIVEAIAAGEPAEAAAAMVDHLANSEAATIARLDESNR